MDNRRFSCDSISTHPPRLACPTDGTHPYPYSNGQSLRLHRRDTQHCRFMVVLRSLGIRDDQRKQIELAPPDTFIPQLAFRCRLWTCEF